MTGLNKLWKIPIIFLIFVTLSAGSGGDSGSSDCLGPLRQMLVEGGYSGGVDCSELQVKLREVGIINFGSIKYSIFDLQYRTIPKGEAVSHGGQKILIFLNDRKYLGQYSLNTPPVHRFRVEGSSVFFELPREYGNEIRVDSAGFPDSVYVDQDTVYFNK